MKKKKHVVVGTGGRAAMFVEAIASRFREHNELVAVCDISRVRMDFYNRRLQEEWNHPPVPTYHADELERMLETHEPDAVVVTSVDSTHHDYIVAALARGCDAITEKPMTIDAEKCREILDAEEKSKGSVRVCFNYRWGIAPTRIKQLLVEGVIGEVKSVALEYALDTSHGADYFRRWHSEKDRSGGLLVHKATHHFDLVNWWIDAIPSEVFAWGDLVFYGKENAVARGDEKWTRYERYTGTDSAGDPFALTLDDPSLRGLYLEAEQETGYLRDRNVFRDGIDIEDTMGVLVKYRTGVVLTYTLNAFSPIEGLRVIFHGTRGRLEYAHFGFGGAHLIRGQGDAELAAGQETGTGFETLRVMPHFAPGYDVEIPEGGGGHGGGDPLIIEQIFSPDPPPEHLHRNAGCEQGAASIMVGVAANESMRKGRPVKIGRLVKIRPRAKRLSQLTR